MGTSVWLDSTGPFRKRRRGYYWACRGRLLLLRLKSVRVKTNHLQYRPCVCTTLLARPNAILSPAASDTAFIFRRTITLRCEAAFAKMTPQLASIYPGSSTSKEIRPLAFQ